MPLPDAIALSDGERRITYAELRAGVDALAERLRTQGTRVLATLMDNAMAWVVADRAAEQAGVVHVPLPVFFTPQQLAHALRVAGVDSLLTVHALAQHWPQAEAFDWDVVGTPLRCLRLPADGLPMPAGTAKLTFTSGTTGTPKGVCLNAQAMQRVTRGLVQALEPMDIRRHLCALPLAVLLENIAGVMAPLARGAECIVPPLAELGLTGSSGFEPARFHAAVERFQPHSLILLPQMLRAWTGWLMQQGLRAPASLRLVAVGGAAVGAPLVLAARQVGIPAHEGYGLSEGASVQTLNLPGADRPGSAGKALPHARLRVAAHGEIEIAGSLFSGYLGEAVSTGEWWPTGDLGEIDADGFVHVRGRIKHVLITAFGRNVSPEWVETALRSGTALAQAVVFGDGEPALSAVVWPLAAGMTDVQIQAGIDAANQTLPDYAQVRHWVRAQAAFSADTGLATANGRPQRSAILDLHAQALGFVSATAAAL
ncbi:AMP-binding protein [Hydrogenophaga sp. A37]|uniref:AMP-binding protein n=1 Tax=Hydrogenophaga sp. A37 TaxID=1945864 RepID=UPI000984DC36|nr:AMP-binding protein [Hydrogenophaga sp. A37]OOG79623.1 long-chain acyl-CoA synthetase [Hydrogenophaga sp. A37]